MDYNGHLGTIELKEGKRPIPPPSDITVRAGSLLFKEGDTSRDVYIVKEGTLSVSQRRGNAQVELAQLSDRSVFGEMSLLDSQPRSATIRAVTDCKLLVIAPITFQGMLRLIPAWLLAVLKVITHRLRETNRKINLHTVPDPMESIAQFLVLQCQRYSRQSKGIPAFPWFPILDEYATLTRLRREEVQKCLQVLAGRGLIASNSAQELIVPDPILLDILREAQHCIRFHAPFPTAALDGQVLGALDALPKLEPSDFQTQDSLLSALQRTVDPRLGSSHVLKLNELGVIHIFQDGSTQFFPDRHLWIQKASRELDRITGKREGR